MRNGAVSHHSIEVKGLSKRFRFPTIPKRATLKDMFVRKMRLEGGGPKMVEALSDVSFEVDAGLSLGVIGRNGSGKTTLLRVMAGVLGADRGEVHIRGTVAPLLSLGVGFHPDLSGRENARIELLTLGLSRAEADKLMESVIEFSEIREFIDAPIRMYSVGMVVRLAFSAAVCVDPDVLMLDEILAVGDSGFKEKCLACIDDFKRAGKTMVLVTHDTSVVAARCDLALWLDRGRVAGFGNPAEVVAAYHRSMDLAPPAVEPVS